MNSPILCTSIAATLCATLAFASTQAIAAKPSGGGSTDCTAAVDFPAFAYWKPAGKTIEILVADATGKCVRSVIKSSGTGGTIQFSYPVSGTTNRGRVVWVAAPSVVSIDFTVNPSTKQITVFAKQPIYTGTGGFISLSKNGSALYSTRFLSSGESVIDRVELDAVGIPIPNKTSAVFKTPAGSDVLTISVNGDETSLFADYKPTSGAAVYELVRIPLGGTNNTTYYMIDSNNSFAEFTPAADPDTARIAYTKYVVASGGGGCDPLVTAVRNADGSYGPPTYPLQPANGLKPTWVNGNVLADGRTATCEYTGTIMQTNPDSGLQKALTSGYDPDGK
jgi:hypothetical protein